MISFSPLADSESAGNSGEGGLFWGCAPCSPCPHAVPMGATATPEKKRWVVYQEPGYLGGFLGW